MISKEQKRSDFALTRLEELKQRENFTIDEEFANFIVGTPTMILQNGFGQTMAFLLSKCKGKTDKTNKYYFAFNAIAKWSNKENKKVPLDKEGFFKSVANLEQEEYLTLQEEALKMLNWLKRYSRAFQKEA